MARYEHLPIYKTAMDLAVYIEQGFHQHPPSDTFSKLRAVLFQSSGVTTQVDRLKAEGGPKSRQSSAFSLNLGVSKRLGFLCNQDSSLIEPTIVETEKVLNGLIRALRDD